MSFDIFLYKFQYGEPALIDRNAVMAVLNRYDFSGPNEYGRYDVRFPDGVDVEFWAWGPGEEDDTNCSFSIRGISRNLISFVWQVAKAGDMSILAPMDPFVPILTSSNQKEHLPADLTRECPEAIVCESPGDLERLLLYGYSDWQKYRDQVIGNST